MMHLGIVLFNRLKNSIMNSIISPPDEVKIFTVPSKRKGKNNRPFLWFLIIAAGLVGFF